MSKFQDDVLFYLSKGRVYNGFDLYESDDDDDEENDDDDFDVKNKDDKKSSKKSKKEDDDDDDEYSSTDTEDEDDDDEEEEDEEDDDDTCPECGKKSDKCKCDKKSSIKTRNNIVSDRGGDGDGDQDSRDKKSSMKTGTHGEEDDDGWHASVVDDHTNGRNGSIKTNSLKEEILAHLNY